MILAFTNGVGGEVVLLSPLAVDGDVIMAIARDEFDVESFVVYNLIR